MELIRITGEPQSVVINPATLREEEYKRALKIVSWKYDERKGRLSIVRKAPHIVGRVIVGNKILSVAPDLEPSKFVDFLLYASGIDLHRFLTREAAGVRAHRGDGHDDFLVLIAHLMFAAAETLSKGYLAKSYEPRRELLQTIRGRPSWTSNFGRHPAAGLVCDYHELQQDNLINQVTLAGLEAASSILGSSANVHAGRILFVWRSLCKPLAPTPPMFDRASKKINRLTESYRPVLALAKSLLFGFAPDDLFDVGANNLQCMQFDVSYVYEKFLERLLRQHFKGSNIQVRAQQGDRTAMVDGWSRTYRSVRPDLLLIKDNKIVAVLDAKYKPKYVGDNATKVSSEDLYQMFFYGSRAKSKSTSENIRLALLAPVISHNLAPPKSEELTVRWMSDGSPSLELTVIPVKLDLIIELLRQGGTASQALAGSTALNNFCAELSHIPRTLVVEPTPAVA